MQDPRDTVRSSRQQTLSTTAPYTNVLYSAVNNLPVNSNLGNYRVMPYSMFPLNQWPHGEGFQHASTITSNLTTIASSDVTSTTSTVANNIPIMSANQAAAGSSNMSRRPYSINHASAIRSFINGCMDAHNFFPLNELKNNVIMLSKSVLYPPDDFPVPILAPKSPVCDTVLVSGLPEQATAEIVYELFEKIGEICSIQLNRNIYAVKFFQLSCVDKASYLNGWKIEIENDDEVYRGTICIDHKVEEASGCISPQPYSDREISVLINTLDDEDNFEEAVTVLTTWLVRGECNKRNVPSFYSAILKANNRVQKLMNEKATLEDNVHKAKLTLNEKIIAATSQLKEFEKALEATRLQKVWDHLTKAQRKNIDNWTKEIRAIQASCLEELLFDRVEDEMEMSDDEGIRSGSECEDHDAEEMYSLRWELDCLQNQLQAAEQDMQEVKIEKEDTVKSLRHDIQSTFEEIQDNERQVGFLRGFLQEYEERSDEPEIQPNRRIPHLETANEPETIELESISLPLEITENETRQIGLIATFLNSHPFGASLDYIASYLSSIDCNIDARDVENLMKQLPNVFKEEIIGVGSSLRKKWKFLGFWI